MSAPVVQAQCKTGKAYQKSLELKEGFEMKTATGIEKSKVWISENLGTKMATRLFRGLALGVLLAAAAGLYFSINQGEAGSTLVRGQNRCYSELSMDCRHDLLSSFFSEQVEEWPQVGFDSYSYHRFMVEQGKVGRVNSGRVDFEIDDEEAMAIYGYPASIFHALNEG